MTTDYADYTDKAGLQPLTVEAAAVRLHDFIRSNAGETADWPIQIRSAQPGAVERLDELLRDVRAAVLGERR